MTPSLKQFMLVSIIGMTLVLAALLYFHVDLSRAYLLDHLGTHNRSMALILRNSLLAGGMGRALGENPERFSAEVIANLDSTLEEELEAGPIVKVKVYGKNSRVLYSTKPVEIGLDASHNGAVLTALLGVPVSDLVERDKLNTLDGSRETLDLHQQYIPIEHPDTGEIQGVFEIYADVSQLIKEAKTSQWTVFWSMSGILVAFYLGIMIAFARTHRALEYERRQRESHLKELMQVRNDLEDRVKERTAELGKSREFLKSVIDGIGSPLQVIRPDRSVMLMNSAARRQIPEGRSETDHPFCYELAHAMDAPCGPPDHPCSFDDVMRHGRPARVRHTHFDDNGEPLIIDLAFTPLFGENGELEGVIEVEHDVTQLVRMQAGLVESEARLQTIMDNVPDAILTCDAECTIQSLNPAALKMFGGGSDLIGEPLKRFFVDADAGSLLEPGAAVRNEVLLRRVDGSEFPADVWLGPLEIADETSCIAVVRDITSRIKAQQELDTTRQQYFQQEKMAALGQLAAGILHEVGNPIAAIAGAASELQGVSVCGSRPSNDCPFDDVVGRNIDLIDEQTNRLARITREIADFASPRPRERELLDLNSLLQSTTRLLSYDRRIRGVDMRLELDTSLPAIVGVADQLTQVFMNLIINAVDACATAEEGHGNRITVESALEGDRVRVTITDLGCGMTRETLDHAMEPFYTTKPVGKGTGLGLSLCDTIARSHGGTLDIDSELGVGTSVHLVLPIDFSEEPPLEQGAMH